MKTLTAVMIFGIIWFVALVVFGLFMGSGPNDPILQRTVPLFFGLGVGAFAIVLLAAKWLLNQ